MALGALVPTLLGPVGIIATALVGALWGAVGGTMICRVIRWTGIPVSSRTVRISVAGWTAGFILVSILAGGLTDAYGYHVLGSISWLVLFTAVGAIGSIILVRGIARDAADILNELE